MRNIRLTIEYDGTRFMGWQAQANTKKLKTVQEEIEKAACKLFGKAIRLKGAGRTDSGVHAEAQTANFKIDSRLPLRNIQKGLNSCLPSDIVIISAEDMPLDFHSRFDAKEKLYRYTIVNRDTRSPLLRRRAAMCFYVLDIGAMKKAAAYLIGKKDFKSFQATDEKDRRSVRHIKRLDIVRKKSSVIEIYIQADGFLYNMVRNIVGTLIDVGRGRTNPDAVKDILKKRHRPAAGQTAPAKGLCLVRVFY
ncbi:MAG: tRNA pseudouridine(38-40) synthase TruA [Candidatus Omnitrophica bacterium]|nr:tRNA pseudouridine(38-40) synthase TruA [Candidatus Omnitrophota bacterium]